MIKDSSLNFRWQRLALAGPAAAVMYMFCLIGFAAIRTDGYTHGTKAVSELGAIGAPYAIWFNLFGFVIPGLLVTCIAVSILKLTPKRTSRTGFVLLSLSGLAMAMAGLFPVDLGARSSLTSSLHLLGATASGLFWMLSLFWIGPTLQKQFGMYALGRLSPWFGLFLVANIAWQAVWQATGAVLPGWGQRIGFAGYFLWVTLVGYSLFKYKTFHVPRH